MNEQTEKESGPVAIIAVHGVADQRKDETSVKAVNLLLQLDRLNEEDEVGGSRESYEGFHESKVHVGIKPLDVSSVTNEDAWHYQLRDHLQDYELDETERVFETQRIEGERIVRSSPDATPVVDRKIHIYEMHWADVSKLKYGILNLFVALYRLLFEAAWIGKQTVGKWASFGDDVGKMSKFTSLRGLMILFHSIATAVLTRFMPLMYLFMVLMLMLTAIPTLESRWAEGIFNGLGGYPGLFTLAVILTIGGLLIGSAFAFWRRIPWPPAFMIVLLVCFLAGNVALALLHGSNGSWWAESGLAILTWIGIAILVNTFVLPVLNRTFPGTRKVGIVLLVFFTIGLIFGLVHRSGWPLLISGPIQALRFGAALLPWAWIILATSANLFLILAMLELFTLWFRRKPNKKAIQRRRSRLRSGIVSITIPVLLISFLNVTFFQLVLIPAKIGGLDGVRPIEGRSADAPTGIEALEENLHTHLEPFVARFSAFPDFEEWSNQNKGPDAVFSDYAKFASEEMVVPFLEFVFLIVLLVLAYSLWIVTPAVLAERKQSLKPGDKRWEKLSVALGKNLTQGYKWIWLGQVTLVGCLLVTQFLFAYRGIRSREIQANPGKDKDPVMVLVDQFLGIHQQEMTEPVVASAITPMAEAQPIRNRPFPGGEAQSKRSKVHFQRNLSKREQTRESIKQVWQQREPIFKQERPSDLTPPEPSPAPVAAEPESRFKEPHPIVLALLTETIVFLNNGPLTGALGISILVLGLGYIFFSRLTDPLVSGLRGGLDVGLDVVSYLHPFPKNRTTRARILNRYASLLHYIVDWRDPRNPEVGYSRIVILTHSQGNVITSDILRALSAGTVARDNGLEALAAHHPGGEKGIPIRLISMGSPLVQLYSARFPDLYEWDQTADPRLNHRGLECWWNLYRSGDYVGRMIFRDLKDKTNFLPNHDFVMKQNGKPIPVRETCIGPGAHTHYWDKSAPASVVRKFDHLITCNDANELAQDSRDNDEEPAAVDREDGTAPA